MNKSELKDTLADAINQGSLKEIIETLIDITTTAAQNNHGTGMGNRSSLTANRPRFNQKLTFLAPAPGGTISWRGRTTCDLGGSGGLIPVGV